MPRREKLPDDLKELTALCRAGKLFDVQRWIADGRRYQLPPGNFTTSPLQVAIHQGFHSLVEVLLEAGAATPCEKNRALAHAAARGKLEMVELLGAHGADPNAVHPDTVFSSRNPQVIRWFIAQGIDLETGYPFARAFQNKQRELLGVYMDIRDLEPSAHKQAAMALRHHVSEGNMKWVSLLLWAGADPRMPVPQLDRDNQRNMSTQR